MDGMIVDRHSYHSHGHFASSSLPMPSSNGQRVTYDDTRRSHSGLALSSATRSDSLVNSQLGSNLWDSHRPHQRNTSYEEQPARSVSYQNDNRPSLPSLRTVLGESARSPPGTPSHQGASLQPLPREPVYDQSTYKPPSLYPNKRTRTDSGWDGQETERQKPDNALSTLPFPSSRQEDRGMAQQRELPVLGGGSPRSYRNSHDVHGYRTSPEHRGRSIHAPTSPRHVGYDSQIRHDPRLQASQHHLPQREVFMDGHPYDSATISHSRSPSTSLAEDGIRRASALGHQGSQQAYGSDGRRQPSLMPTIANAGYRDEYPGVNRLDGSHNYNGASYPYSQAFFVPSHYEYQNGKSRKRSNLPKQSTEIMKRWFDENLQNPYPSEEQKRHFAAVAGINLTQVSNWFINHRRRCPELREKRDKGRAGSRDESV